MIIEVEILKVFLLVAARFSGLMVAAPLLGSGNFPVMGKIGLVGLSAMLVTPGVPALEAALPSDPLALALMATGEVLIGLAIGLVMTLVFAAIQVAGQIMDMQSGFGMMNVFNPALETQFPIFGFFYFIMAILYLLILDGHHLMIRALTSTFETIPLGGLSPDENVLWAVVNWGTGMFYDAVLISAPIVAAMMLAYITMGLMGRVVPQIHMFVVGFPLTIATGLLVVAFSIDLYLRLLNGMFADMFRNVETLIRGLG